jgi:tetratricopeptide (TPR) repeat protein
MKIHPSVENVRRLVEGLHPQVRRTLEHLMRCSRCRALFLETTGPRKARQADNVLPWPAALTVASAAKAAGSGEIGEGGEIDEPLFPLVDDPPSICDGEIPDELGMEAWLLGDEASPLESWAVAERLLEASRRQRHEDPQKAESLALAAGRVAELMGAEPSRAMLAHDLQALAWAYVGAARRDAGDLRGSDEALGRARSRLRGGSGDCLERAVVAEHVGLLRKYQRRFDGAERWLTRAGRLYASIGDREGAGRALLHSADVLREQGQVEESIRVLTRAAAEVGDRADPLLALAVRHNLAITLTAAERWGEAERLLTESADLYARFPDESTRARLRWLEAKIARGKGLVEEAERGFLAVRQSFIDSGVGYDAAMVSLELATLYAELGRFSHMRRLADEMLPIFRAQDIHREALAALVVFQQAARMENVTLELAREIAAYLDRARGQPELRFEPAAS